MMIRYKILLIDDESEVLNALNRILSKEYAVSIAKSGGEALKILVQHRDLALIVCDQRMPEMTGVEFLKSAKVISPKAIRILLTGYSDIEAVIAAINEGAVYRYLTKPWEPEILKQEIKNALEYYEFLKSKDHFLMMVAHELRTPLTTILAFTESYLRHAPLSPKEQMNYIEKISIGAKRLERLVQDILDLTALEMGTNRMEPHQTNISLKSVLDTAVSAHTESIKNKKIKVHYTGFKNISIQIDGPSLHKAMAKILEYIVSISDEGAKISLMCKKDGHVGIEIGFQGKTLTDYETQHLFDPFAIAGDILTHTVESSLGLPIARSLIEALGGHISYKVPGTFVINFSSR